ncbi:MAG: right-handed parallel beta-helix repeat-containing protein [Planctomycetes bacterium]|nr:right-handed parallel beta-helix repeat-containing protein [Planctomycetota bacterium]
MRFPITVLLLGSVVARFSWAATYYADPEKGKPDNDGSAAAPWRTLEEVAKSGKLAKLKGGDTLLLATGKHGDVRIDGNNDEFITIAAGKDQTPQLSRLEITQGRKWLVKGLTISPVFGSPYKGTMLSIGERGESSELVVEDCFVYTAEDSSKWTVEDWMKANDGVWLGRHGTKLTLRNTYVLNTRFGINLCAPGSLCEGCVVCNFSGDGMRVTRDGITVQYCVVKNCYVSAKDGDENHDDGIQCFLFNKGTGTVRNGTLRGNILINREDDKQPFQNAMQGFGFFDGPLIDFLVEKNVVLTAHWHGVSLYDAQNCKILDNACYSRWKDEKPRPWVMLGSKEGQAKGNTVKGNMACSFDFKADAAVTAENNIPVTEEAFNQKMKEAEAAIAEKFGRFHPVAKYARLGMEKGENAPPKPAVPEKTAVAKPVTAAPPEAELQDAALKVWNERLAARVAAVTKDGKRPETFLKVFGKQPEKIKLAASSATELQVVVQGNTMPFAWAKLDREDRFNLARSVADESKAADLALEAVWALAAGRREAAEELLAKAKQAPGQEEAAQIAEAQAVLGAR